VNGGLSAGQPALAIQTLLGRDTLSGLKSSDWQKEPLEKLPVWPNNSVVKLLHSDIESAHFKRFAVLITYKKSPLRAFLWLTKIWLA
jgi:hypothetical protein